MSEKQTLLPRSVDHRKKSVKRWLSLHEKVLDSLHYEPNTIHRALVRNAATLCWGLEVLDEVLLDAGPEQMAEMLPRYQSVQNSLRRVFRSLGITPEIKQSQEDSEDDLESYVARRPPRSKFPENGKKRRGNGRKFRNQNSKPRR